MFSGLASILLFVVLVTKTTHLVDCHTSIADPTPISFVNACRMGNRANCPGPCPNQLFRRDKSFKKVRRGGIIRVRTKKNNHFGGFARWSIVKVKHMWKKHKHAQGAFLFTCHDLRLSRCDYKNRDWCQGDKTNQYYSHRFRIPEVYPDGDYVLGLAWYGGLFSQKTLGDFGDYYDCAYLRVQGGRKSRKYKPQFHAGPSATGRRGYCLATVNRLGPCWREPCRPHGRALPARMLKAHEFIDGRRPEPIRYRDFV